MLLLRSIVMREVYWLLRPQDDQMIPLAEPSGWALVNPLVPVVSSIAVSETRIPNRDGGVFLAAKVLTFAIPKKNDSDADLVDAFLRKLRFVTGQASLPTEVGASLYETVDALPETPPSQPITTPGALRAIETCRLIFSWFGAPGKYQVPYHHGEREFGSSLS